MIVPRRSGRRMLGVGVVMSSKTIVSRIPGRSSASNGSESSGASSARADGVGQVRDGRQRLGRVDHPRAEREPLQPEVVAVGDDQRWGAFVDFEDESRAGH